MALAPPPPGLCGVCRWARCVRSARGSVFYLCTRSRQDPHWPKYPRLPVTRCPGFEPGEGIDTPPAAPDAG